MFFRMIIECRCENHFPVYQTKPFLTLLSPKLVTIEGGVLPQL